MQFLKNWAKAFLVGTGIVLIVFSIIEIITTVGILVEFYLGNWGLAIYISLLATLVFSAIYAANEMGHE